SSGETQNPLQIQHFHFPSFNIPPFFPPQKALPISPTLNPPTLENPTANDSLRRRRRRDMFEIDLLDLLRGSETAPRRPPSHLPLRPCLPPTLQWMEYCARSRKRTCPVCKQVCADKDVARLYFQSAGDVIGGGGGGEGEEVEVRLDVKRMESKVWGLGLEVERWKKDVERLNDELSITKEQLSSTKEQLAREETMKKEAIKQKMYLQGVLQKKSSELLQSAVECSKLQESNLALAKELAALKLLSDCNLGEDDILKLASLGNEASSQDVVDVLKKSLVIRN
ncbi:hypothetical protein AKJ16_DCAP19377, partial [Drosera capensis]